mgnify:CR=1 FL=1
MPFSRQPQEVLGLHNTQSGRVFIMGAGASLAGQRDILPDLANEDTLGVNQLPSWSELPFTLTYYATVSYTHLTLPTIYSV